MTGIPENPPDELIARQIAFGYNFTPYARQFYDQWKYASGSQVFKFAVGDKTTNIDFLVEDWPNP